MSEPAIARLIGEGVERPEATLPIDINYAKLTEWLVTRQKIPKDWHKRLQVIQAKAAEAVKELPPGTLTSLTDGADAPVDYMRAVEIRDKLASTSERTMFGGLQGPAATWDKIVKAYEKQYVYLGEAAQSLIQNVDFEIPYLRRNAAKLSGQLADGERKQGEYVRAAAACAAKYKEECKKLGIAGSAVRSELRALAGELPALLRGVVDSLHEGRLQEAADYYAAFTRFAHAPRAGAPSSAKGPASTAAAAPAVLEPGSMLPVLFEIRNRRTVPPKAEAAEPAGTSGQAGGGIEIDWGDSAGGDAGAGTAPIDIDWDAPAAAAPEPDSAAAAPAVDINWDFDMADLAAAAGGDDAAGAAPAAADASSAGPAGIDINWDIEVDAAGDAAADANNRAGDAPDGEAAAAAAAGGGAGSLSAGSGSPDDVAAARLERDADYRARLVDDLMELRAFLAQRKADLTAGGSELTATALPESVSSVDAATVLSLLGAVQGVLAQLGSPRFRQLLLIATSPRYLDRLEARLQRQAGAEAKMLAAAAEAAARQHEARAGLAAQAPRTAALVGRCRRLKGLVERGIAASLGGKRSVNVLGEINNVLAASS